MIITINISYQDMNLSKTKEYNMDSSEKNKQNYEKIDELENIDRVNTNKSIKDNMDTILNLKENTKHEYKQLKVNFKKNLNKRDSMFLNDVELVSLKGK